MSFTKIAQLGHLNDDDFPAVDLDAGLTITREGNFLASNLHTDRVLVYDSTGKLLRIVGTSGKGPGEFFGVRQISLIGKDTILVGDVSRMLFFGPTFKHLETFALGTPFMRRFLALAGHRFLTLLQTDRNFGPQPMVLGRDGYRRMANKNTPEPRCPTCNWMLSTTLYDGGGWLVHSNSNSFERWSQMGQLVRTVTFEGSLWFKPWFNATTKADVPQKPYIAGVGEDASKRMWIFGSYPTPDAKPARTLQKFKIDDDGNFVIPPGGVAPNAAIQAQWVSVVDVFDPVTGLLYVSHVIPGKVLRLLTPPYFAQPVQSPDGFDALIIYRMDIRKR
ncbi:MAG: hypothetical protein ABJB74_14005 [Gemmatimonas sp.]